MDFLPRNFNLSIFFFFFGCVFWRLLKIRMQRDVVKMILGEEKRQVHLSSKIKRKWSFHVFPLFSLVFLSFSPSPPPFPLFFRPYMVSLSPFFNSKSTTLSVFVCTPYYTRWNSGMTTMTRIVQMRSRWTCLVLEVSVHCTYNVCLNTPFYFVLFFSTTKAGYANIFEIKCNYF